MNTKLKAVRSIDNALSDESTKDEEAEMGRKRKGREGERRGGEGRELYKTGNLGVPSRFIYHTGFLWLKSNSFLLFY